MDSNLIKYVSNLLLKYLLPYSCQLSSGRKDFKTLSCVPGSVWLYSDIVDSNMTSINYNKHIIDEYIYNNILTSVMGNLSDLTGYVPPEPEVFIATSRMMFIPMFFSMGLAGEEGTTGDITDGSVEVSFLSINIADSKSIDKVIISTATNTPVTSDSVDKLIIIDAENFPETSDSFNTSIIKSFSSDYSPVLTNMQPIKFTARIL